MGLEKILNGIKRKVGLGIGALALGASALFSNYGCGGKSADAPPVDDEYLIGNEGQAFNYQANWQNPPSPIVNISVNGTIPSWMTVDLSQGIISGTPTFADSGQYDLDFVASNPSQSATKHVYITINDVNRNPNNFTMTGSTNITEGDMTKLTFSNFSDPDGDLPLIFSLTNAPAESTWDEGTKTLTFIADFNDGDGVSGYKDYSMTASLDDLKGGVTEMPVTLRVTDNTNPDRILCQDENFFLYSMLPDGTDLQTAGKVGEQGTRARFYSLDRNKLTTSRVYSGNVGVYLEDVVGGTNQTLISDSTANTNLGAAVSPDGGLVALVDNRTGYHAVHLFNATNGNYIRKATSNTNAENGAAYSPDGIWIYYAANKSGQWDICRFKADGTGSEENITNTATINEGHLDISPDGTELACSVDDGSTIAQIWTMNAVNGTNRNQITNSSGDSGDYSGAWYPNYSPDGKKLIYSEGLQEGNTITKGDLTILYKDASGNYSESRTVSDPSGIFVWPDW